MSTIHREVEIVREMWRQGVGSSLRVKGPIGDAYRADPERRTALEALVAMGKLPPSILLPPV